MDLHSGLPYWIVKNSLYDYYNPLKTDHRTEVAIIGSGITGALVAHELCKAGIQCCVIDKRSIATGSSAASTALLQYEIDTPLCKLAEKIGEEDAALAYKSCLKSIDDIKEVLLELNIDASFEKHSNLYYASNKKGFYMLEKELDIRLRNDLPVTLLEEDELWRRFHIKAPGALYNDCSAQMDPYAAATGIWKYYLDQGKVEIFNHTEITDWKQLPDGGYQLESACGHKVHCRYVVIAAGFEAERFLPEKVMKLTSTYALISEPVEPEKLWPERCLIWETAQPYLYIRTINGNRIIVGGEDEEFSNPVSRDRLLRKKTEKLKKKFQKLFPDIPFDPEMAWCGTFSSTEDGLPFIGAWEGNNHMLFALGYGGNGITFSMIAAQIIRKKIQGMHDERERVLGFERMEKEKKRLSLALHSLFFS